MDNQIDGTLLFEQLAINGYHVIPIAPNSKIPSKYNTQTKEWVNYKSWSLLLDNPDAVKRAIWCKWPAPGVGFMTGKHHTGIDLDITHPELMKATLELFAKLDIPLSRFQRQGQAPKLLLLYSSLEPFVKLYSQSFALPGHPKNQIEVLSKGQQFVGYGIHPKTNEPYIWPDLSPMSPMPHDISIISAEKIKLLLQAFNELALSFNATLVTKGNEDNAAHIASSAQADKRGLAKQAVTYLQNDNLHYEEWIRIGLAIKAAFPEDVAGAYEIWMDFSAKCGDKFSAELSDKKFPTFRPDKIGVATLYHLAKQAGWVNPNPIAATDPVDDFAAIPGDDDILPAGTAPKRNRLYVVNYDDMTLDIQGKPLVSKLLDHHTLSILYGESNVGKTFVAMDLAFHIAAGLPWNGHKTTQGAVVYVAAEGGKGAKHRMLALKKKHGIKSLPLFLIPCSVDLLRKDADTKPLIDLCLQCAPNISLIVIDTLSRALAGGNENSSDDMGAFVLNIDRIRTATAAHTTIVHHSGKDTSKGARGHSLLRAAADTELEIADNQLKITKQRDMEMIAPLAFQLETHQLGISEDGEPITSCTINWSATIMSDFSEVTDLFPREIAMLAIARDMLLTFHQIKIKELFDICRQDDMWPKNERTAERHMQDTCNNLVTKNYFCRVGRLRIKPGEKCYRKMD